VSHKAKFVLQNYLKT